MRLLEDKHWWFIGRRKIIESVLDKFYKKPTSIKQPYTKRIGCLAFSVVICLIGYLSYRTAIYFSGTDFSVFYCAGKIALDPDIPSRMVYDIKTLTSCAVPEVYSAESRQQLHFIYSIPAAYLLSPLMLLPYFQAKALLITINMLSYVASIPMLLNKISPQNNLARSKYFLLTCFWPPFWNDIEYGQINSILLLLICMASVSANRKPYLAGFILGIVSLFKLFPFGIAVYLGLKNWRITAVCLLTTCIGILISGSQDWFMEMSNISSVGVTPIYKLLTDYEIYWYFSYVMIITGITALTILSSPINYFFITAISIPALFIIMPIVEYHHLVLLIFSFIYIILSTRNSEWLIKSITAISITLIPVSQYYDIHIHQGLIVLSSFILWILLIIQSIEHKQLKYADEIEVASQ